MKNFIKSSILIICIFITLILLVGCGKKTQSKENETNSSETNLTKETETQIDWKSNTKGVQAAEIILKLEANMSFNDAENILSSNSATKDDKYIRGQYKFPDGSKITVRNDEDTSALNIDISFPEEIQELADENVNLSNYKNINAFGTYIDYVNGFGTNGVLASKYHLSSGDYIYNYYWIKDRNNYAHANFYKSTGKMLSAQLIINGKQQNWND